MDPSPCLVLSRPLRLASRRLKNAPDQRRRHTSIRDIFSNQYIHNAISKLIITNEKVPNAPKPVDI